MAYSDGKVYEGTWFPGKQDGKGSLIDRAGRKETANWERGVVINRI